MFVAGGGLKEVDRGGFAGVVHGEGELFSGGGAGRREMREFIL